MEEIEEELVPFVRLNGSDIHFEVVGDRGPWVTLITRARQPLQDFTDMAQQLAGRGFRVLLFDRRNCGHSSFDIDLTEAEEEAWTSDLAALLEHLHAPPTTVLGWSRGARVAIRLARRQPELIAGLVLWGLSGGPIAVRFLEDYYFGKHVRAARTGGMDAVCASGYFADLIAHAPAVGDYLRTVDTERFLQYMERQRHAFLVNSEQMVMGLTNDDLRGIQVPVVIVPYYDKIHPLTVAEHAHRMIPGSIYIDYSVDRWTADPALLPGDQEARDRLVIADIVAEYGQLWGRTSRARRQRLAPMLAVIRTKRSVGVR